jgi:hypothetical protein
MVGNGRLVRAKQAQWRVRLVLESDCVFPKGFGEAQAQRGDVHPDV